MTEDEVVMGRSNASMAKELAEAHWDWFKSNLYEMFKVAYIMGVSSCGEEYTQEGLQSAWNLIEPLIGRVYMDSMAHGIKHGYDSRSWVLAVEDSVKDMVEKSLKDRPKK